MKNNLAVLMNSEKLLKATDRPSTPLISVCTPTSKYSSGSFCVPLVLSLGFRFKCLEVLSKCPNNGHFWGFEKAYSFVTSGVELG